MIAGQFLGQYTSLSGALTIIDATQFCQLRSTSAVLVEILEARVTTAANTVISEGIKLERGTGGAGGSNIFETNWVQGQPISIAQMIQETPTTEVTGVDWSYRMGFNNVNEAVFLPTPEMQLWLRPDDDFAMSLIAVTGFDIRYSVTWREYEVA
jgi:hypothetical protein